MCTHINLLYQRLNQCFPTFFDAFLPVFILELFIPPRFGFVGKFSLQLE